MFIDTKNNLKVFLIRHGQNQLKKKLNSKCLKKIMSGAILMGRPEYTKQIKWIFKFDLKLNAKNNRFYKFDIRYHH